MQTCNIYTNFIGLICYFTHKIVNHNDAIYNIGNHLKNSQSENTNNKNNTKDIIWHNLSYQNKYQLIITNIHLYYRN